jgi:hypothetical protein
MYLGEVGRLAPLSVIVESREEFETEDVVPATHEAVEEKELANHVGTVHDFDHQV